MSETTGSGIVHGIDIVRIQFQGSRLGADCAKLAEQIIHMVEDVKELGSEFQMHLFANRKLLDQRRVPGLISRPFNDVASGIAKGTKHLVVRKRAGIE